MGVERPVRVSHISPGESEKTWLAEGHWKGPPEKVKDLYAKAMSLSTGT